MELPMGSFKSFADKNLELFEEEILKIVKGEPEYFRDINQLLYYLMLQSARWGEETAKANIGKS